MSTGFLVFAGALLAVGMIVAMQLAMGRIAQRRVGTEAPAVAGQLGQAVKGDALLFFHSPTCGPCRAMEPHVANLAAHDERVHSVDVTRDFDLARAFGVMATPTTIVVKGGTIAEAQLGAVPRGKLEQMLASLGSPSAS